MRFQRLESLIGTSILSAIKKKIVIVYGLGGVGGYACEALVRSGVGTVHLVDFDCIETSNINRQIIALTSTIGLMKTDVFAQRIHDINPLCEVHIHTHAYTDQMKTYFADIDVDFVIDAIDDVNAKVHLLKMYRLHEVPIISSMGFANKMHPEEIQIAHLNDTSVCPLARTIRRRLKKEDVPLDIPVVFSTEKPTKPLDGIIKLGSNAFVPSTAGLYMASYVINQWTEELS